MQLTVPTIFTGVDKISALFSKMGSGVSSFAEKTERAAARGERAFKKFTPTLSETGHKFLELGEEAVSAAAIFETLKFSGEALVEYDTALSALRTKLSDLSDKDFTKFQDKINEVAYDTKESSVEVAAGFEKILTLNKKFGETADSLGEVSKASILLSKIQKTDVATSADGLVGIMNLYNIGAEKADEAVNVLATSQSKFASSITDTMAGLTAFAPLAKHYNIGLQQSTALLDILAEKQIKGEAAGATLRQTIIKLQAAHAGYKSGVFNLSDALEQVRHRLDKLRTAKEKDNFISGLLGKRQQATGILLLENFDKLKKYTTALTGSTEAEKLAEISENNLGSRLTQLKNRWVDLLTRQDKANSGLNIIKKTIVFVTDHLETLVTIGASILGFFLAWKLALIGTNIILGLYNIALGITGALTGVVNIAVGQSAAGLFAYRVALWLSTAALWLYNTAAAATVAVMESFAGLSFGAGLAKLAGFLGPIAALLLIVVNYVNELIDDWDHLKKTFSDGGWMKGLGEAMRGLVASLVKQLQTFFLWISKITGLTSIGKFATEGMPVGDKQWKDYVENGTSPANPKPALAPPMLAAQQQGLGPQSLLNHSLDININDPFSVVQGAPKASGPFPIPVQVSKTQGAK